MKGQMNLFDFIEKLEEQTIEKSKNIQGQLMYIVDNPVIQCVNCVCQYCVNNQEEVWDKVRPDEVIEPCFNCDECYEFTGDCRHRRMLKEHCDKFVLSDYGAARNRKHIKLIRDGGKNDRNQNYTK